MSVIPQNYVGGFKDKEGKVPLELLPPDALLEIGRVFARGAKKYDERNVELGLPWGDLLGAAKRHMAKFEMGEDVDIDPLVDDGGVLHTAAAAWALLMLTAYQLRPHLKSFDNRSPYIRPQSKFDISSPCIQPQSKFDISSEDYEDVDTLLTQMMAQMDTDGFRNIDGCCSSCDDTCDEYESEDADHAHNERIDNMIETLRFQMNKEININFPFSSRYVSVILRRVFRHVYGLPNFFIKSVLTPYVMSLCRHLLEAKNNRGSIDMRRYQRRKDLIDMVCRSVKTMLSTDSRWE